MLCKFKKLNHDIICERCGRKISHAQNKPFISAKCRLPEKYITDQKNIYYQRKKIYPGIGSCLLMLLGKLNVHYDQLSTAKSKANYLDKQGIDWCENNQDIILGWIKEESNNKNITYNPKLAKILLRLAIKQSKHYRSLVI